MTQEAADELSKILEDVFSDTAELSKLSTTRFWSAWQRKNMPSVLRIAPAVGKTHKATELVDHLFKNDGVVAGYFLPSHKICGEVHEKYPHWNHWKGHAQFGCDIYAKSEAIRDAGFAVSIPKCNCKFKDQTFKADKPTVTVIDYLKPVDFSSLWGRPLRGGDEWPDMLRPEVENFALRVVDEMDFGRFVPEKSFDKWEVIATRDHPVDVVSKLADGLTDLMLSKELATEKYQWINGESLISRLCEVLTLSLQELSANLKSVAFSEVSKAWSFGKKIPGNLPAYLVPILLDEVNNLIEGKLFNPRIHLSPDRVIIRYRLQPPTIVPTLFLDASADPYLLDVLFSISGTKSIDLRVPAATKTYQWLGSRVTKSSMDFTEDAPESDRDQTMVSVLEDLERAGASKNIAVITHKKWKDYVEDRLTAAGYMPELMHFWNLRSSNDLKHLDTLLILGTPIPHPTAFAQEVQAFFYDEYEVEIKHGWKSEQVLLRDGTFHDVSVQGYRDDPRVVQYYRNKCQEELFQAVHRIRPLRAESPQTIVIYSDIPIRDVPIDHALGPFSLYVDTIKNLCESGTKIGASAVAFAMEEPGTKGSRRKVVERNRELLAGLAKVDLDGNKFVKR